MFYNYKRIFDLLICSVTEIQWCCSEGDTPVSETLGAISQKPFTGPVAVSSSPARSAQTVFDRAPLPV